MDPDCGRCGQHYRNCKCNKFAPIAPSDLTTIRLEYKCRRCSQVKDNSGTSKDNSFEVMLSAIHQSSSRLNNNSPIPMLDFHSCKDGGKGIADFIGHSAPRE